MKSLLIIDGYNVIKNFYAGSTSFSDKRKQFIKDISNCLDYKDFTKVVVFDSKEQSFDYSEKVGEIKVIYSGYHKSADSIIENIVTSNTSYNKIIVVTSDLALQQVIFGVKNTLRKSSREFYYEISKK